MFPVKRPSAKDTEEDILQFQEKFLKEKSKPAACVNVKDQVAHEKTLSEASNEVDMPSKPVVFNVQERGGVRPAIVHPSGKAQPFPKASKSSSDFSVKRPSAKDTEEDILQFQEKFLKEKSKPAASVIVKDQVAPEKTFSEASSKRADKITDEVDMPSKPVLFDIQERDVVSPAIILPSRRAQPFPKPSKRSYDVRSAKGRKSIFAQQAENAKESNQKQSLTLTPRFNVFDGPVVVDGSGLRKDAAEREAQSLHEESVAKLSAMSEEEKLTEQALLLERLDPQLIDFVRNRRISKSAKPVSKHGTISSNVNLDQSLAGMSSNNMCENSSLRRDFPPSSSTSDFKILKLSKDYDHEGIILQNVSERKLTEEQSEMDVASLNKDAAHLHEMETENIKLPEEELPINPKEATKWVHMDKVEKRKLEWMTMLPKPKPIDFKTGFTARFDFQGKLLCDESVPTQMGLHHHSEEAELPGYTIEELFLLSRSSVQSQRVMALQTLAYIMENNWQGMFDGCFEEPLLVYLLNAGIAPLLRWALDDTTDSCIAASVMAVHHLLLCPTDEMCLDMVFPLINGHFSPFIKPYGTEQVPEDNLEELTDANIIKLDVIKGFLRMDIIPRLKYILLIPCPPLSVCQLIMEILARLARHSNESAKMIVECPLLFEIIFKKFLPHRWDLTTSTAETRKTDDFVCPVPCAMKLIRIICSSSIELASHLVTNRHLESLLSYYIHVCMSVSLPKLMVETLRTWRVLLAYGFCTNLYVELFPVILRQLQCFEAISISTDSDVHIADCMFASLFFKALESVVATAGDDPKKLSAFRPNSVLPVVSVTWNQVCGLFPIVKICLQKWLYEFSRGECTTAGSVLLASCIDFFSIYCLKAEKQLDLESLEAKTIQNVIIDYLLPCIKSVSFNSALQNLGSYSVLLYSGLPGTKRSTSTLTSLGTILWKNDIVPILRDGTPFPLVTSVIGLLTTISGFLCSSDAEPAKLILLHPSVIEYIAQVAVTSKHFNHWFDRLEAAFFCQLTELASLQVCGNPTMWHRLSLSLLLNIRRTDEWIIKSLMEKVIFNDAFLLYNDYKLSPLIDESKRIGSSDVIDDFCKDDVLKEKLQRISQVYVDFFLSSASVEISRQKWMKTTYNCRISIDDDLKPIIPCNWPYEPLLILYQQSKNSEIVSSELPEKVRAFLEWIYLLQQLCLPAFNQISASTVFCHICMVFILDSCVFFDTKVKSLLQSNLSCLVRCEKLKELEKVCWNVNSKFDDLFADLVVQFEAESYGDHVFTNYLLVAFQQCYPSRWKNFVFIEHPQVVQSIRIPLSKLTVPLMNFLEPKEKDTVLLSQYLKALTSNLLIPERSPLLYLMAVHHLHNHIFMSSVESSKFQKTLLKSLMLCKKKEVISRVLLYKNPNENEKLGFEMAEHLTPENELHLRNLYGEPIKL